MEKKLSDNLQTILQTVRKQKQEDELERSRRRFIELEKKRAAELLLAIRLQLARMV